MVKTLSIVPVFLVPIPWRSCSCLTHRNCQFLYVHGHNVIQRSCVPGPQTVTLQLVIGSWIVYWSIIHLSPYGGGWWDQCLVKWQLIASNDQSIQVRMEEDDEIIALLNGNWSTCMKTMMLIKRRILYRQTRKMLIKRWILDQPRRRLRSRIKQLIISAVVCCVRTVYYFNKQWTLNCQLNWTDISSYYI